MGSSSKTSPLTAGWLARKLSALNPDHPDSRYVIAYSGGVDSHVLLQLCVDAALPVRAIHVHHGLQAPADDWVRHCQQICRQLGIELQVCYVDAAAGKGESPEEVARTARYRAIEQALRAGEILLLAQHGNDQAETVLLQMLRGAGAAGLSAMPAASRTATGSLMLRPLLSVHRRQIMHYARARQLDWVEDPSNHQARYRRNVIRHDVLPAMLQHWPRADDALQKVAQQQQRTRQLIDDLARIDLAACVPEHADGAASLHISGLLQLDHERRFNVLRYWLHSLGARPNRRCIEQIIDTLLTAAADAVPTVSWGRHEVRRFDGRLFLLQSTQTRALDEQWLWTPVKPLPLPALGSQLLAASEAGSGLRPDLLQAELCVRFRRGGEVIRPCGSSHQQSLKKLFQQAAVPPWQRQRIPLLFLNDGLLAVCGYWLAQEYCVPAGESGWIPELRQL